eukprot:scaffold108155_cov31-Prasinocladus_malaysianus.AAC.2
MTSPAVPVKVTARWGWRLSGVCRLQSACERGLCNGPVIFSPAEPRAARAPGNDQGQKTKGDMAQRNMAPFGPCLRREGRMVKTCKRRSKL